MTASNEITAMEVSGGQSLAVAGGSYRILVSGEQTSGNYAVIDMLVPPGGGPNPHAHKKMQEMFYVADGEVEFKMDSGTYLATKGAFINIPLGGAVHCFKNTGTTVAHLLCTVIPAGLEDLFKQIGKPVDAGVFLAPPLLTDADKEKIKLLGEKFGQEFYPPDYFDK